MPVYIYEGKALDGTITKGKAEVDNTDEVKNMLRAKGIYPVSIREESKGNDLNFGFLKEIPYKDLAILCRQMHFTLSAGIPMLRAIDIVKQQMENKKLKKILENIYEEVQKGSPLSKVFHSHKDVPYMLSAMVEVGEATGELDKIMGDMADYYDKQHRQKKKIDTALTYPKFLLGFALIIVVGLVTFVVPTFVEGILSAGQELPVPTQIVINISYFIKQNFILLIGIVFILFLIKKVFIDKNQSIQFAIDRFLVKDKYLAAISQQIFTARFARTFGILVAGGMNVMDSMDIAGNAVDNLYIKKSLEECKSMISSGAGIGESLEIKKVFPMMLTQMMKVGEETGSLDSILKKTSEYYEIEADFALQKLTAMIEPAMIIFLAVIVGFVVISIAMPMFQIMGAV